MFGALKQFVPSDVCLKCDGCCRFKEEKSAWRPKVTAEERADMIFSPSVGSIFSRRSVDKEERIVTRPCASGHHCTFLHEDGHTCRIYGDRPLECSLYPFVLSRRGSELDVSAHLSCPYVQEHWKTKAFNEHVHFLQKYFEQTDVANFFRRNSSFGDGNPAQPAELDRLFIIDLNSQPLGAGQTMFARRAMLTEALALAPGRTSAHAFPALAVWDGSFHFSFQSIDGALCVFASDSLGTFLFLPPLAARLEPGVIPRSFERMNELNGPTGYSRIENVPLRLLPLFPEEKFYHHRKAYEYCYYRRDIVELHGNPYKSQRSEYNQFVKGRSFEFVPFETGMTEECLALFHAWRNNRREKHPEEIYRQMLEDSRAVHETVLRQAGELGFTGRVVRVDGNIKAYTFGYPLSGEEFCVFLEIADGTIDGLPTFIFREFCSDPGLAPYRFINCMDDFAMPDVQRTKMAFKPALLWPVYTVTLR